MPLLCAKSKASQTLEEEAEDTPQVEFGAGAAVVLGELVKNGLEVGAIDELHGQEELTGAGVLAELMDRDDVRVGQLAVDLGLLDEASLAAFIVWPVHGFHGERAIQDTVTGEQDSAHSPFAELLFDDISSANQALIH
jgi:hypothetical protein